MELDSNYFPAYSHRGFCKIIIQDCAGVIYDYSIAYSLDTLSRSAISNLGSLYMLTGNLDSAMFCFNKSIIIDSVYGSYYIRGSVYALYSCIMNVVTSRNLSLQLHFQKGR
jgi:hypothetical protein